MQLWIKSLASMWNSATRKTNLLVICLRKWNIIVWYLNFFSIKMLCLNQYYTKRKDSIWLLASHTNVLFSWYVAQHFNSVFYVHIFWNLLHFDLQYLQFILLMFWNLFIAHSALKEKLELFCLRQPGIPS